MFQVADAVAKCLSNPDLDLGSRERVWSQLAPRKQVREIAAVASDLVRSRCELVLENAVLRHQVNVLRRGGKRRKFHLVDRLKLLLGARWLPSSRQAIVLVQPETVLRWHRADFRRYRRRRFRPQKASPLSRETIGGQVLRDRDHHGLRAAWCRDSGFRPTLRWRPTDKLAILAQ
jgi:hypothetical protein